MQSTDLHDDIAEDITNLVNEKVNRNTLFTSPEMSPYSKSSGLDGIGVCTLKVAAPAKADLITYICHFKYKYKSFPEKRKEGKVF